MTSSDEAKTDGIDDQARRARVEQFLRISRAHLELTGSVGGRGRQ